MSEPGAGSDLAGSDAPARSSDGDHFVVNGQKVWTSGAHDADVHPRPSCAPTRTRRSTRASARCSIPTDTPGVARRPFASVYDRDDLDFNEVFFTDVRVPAENLVGPLNGGWRVANGSLGPRTDDDVDGVRQPVGADCSRTTGPSATVEPRPLRDHRRWTIRRCACSVRPRSAQAARGERDIAGVSVLKVLGSEAEQNAYRARARTAAGVDGLTDPALTAPYNPYSPDLFTASWFARYISSYAGTIAGGTSEIQRNIIAQRVLGLPAR